MLPVWVTPYLTNLTRTGAKVRSAQLAGITSGAARALYNADADFAAAVDEALLAHAEHCEAELTRRAFGYEDPVVYQGQLTPVWERDEQGELVQVEYEVELEVPVKGGGSTERKVVKHKRPVQARNEDGSLKWLTVTKFSDTLLLAKVKAVDPRYRIERTELTGADGAPVEIDATTRRARIAAILAKAQVRKVFGDIA